MAQGPTVSGSDKVIEIFGHWPSFHDAYVNLLRLEARKTGDGDIATELESVIQTAASIDDIEALVHFRFRSISELQLNWSFHSWNYLFALSIEELAKEFYETLFTLKDGFSGRNLRSTKRVTDPFKAQIQKGGLKNLISSYATRCKEFSSVSEAEKRCKEHFNAILLAKG